MDGQKAGPGGSRPDGGKPPDFDLLRHNLGMATALEEFLTTTYGPGGRAKLFDDEKGKVVATTNGARMLEKLESDHPVTTVLRAAALAQEDEWRDGTKAAVLLGLRLLRRAEEMLDAGVRPLPILEGYRRGLDLAAKKASEVARDVDPTDETILLSVARTCLGTWPDGTIRDALAEAVVQAALQVAEPTENGWRCDRWKVHIFPMGGSGFSLETINGYVLKQVRDYHGLPRRVENARIALFDAAPMRGKAGIHAPRLRWAGETKFILKSPSGYKELTDWGAEYTREIIRGLQQAGANVVLCRLGISDHALKLLADAGILGIRRLMRTRRMENLAHATGASLIKDFKTVLEADLGQAGLVEERRYGEEKVTVITDCADAKLVSLIVRAPGEGLGEQYKDLLRKAIGAVAAVIEDPRVVVGGSALEAMASQHVRREAAFISGRAQLGAEAFGRALEDLAAIMATNMGLDAVDTLLELRRLHTQRPTYGLRDGAREPVDLAEGPVFDPLVIRLAAWARGMDACRTILRVDAFHRSRGTLKEEEVEERKEKGPTPVKPSLEEN